MQNHPPVPIHQYPGGGLHHISNLHPFYLPLHYVLLFPNGEVGWHLDIPLQQQNGHQHCSKKGHSNTLVHL
jgi:hypothetical protein